MWRTVIKGMLATIVAAVPSFAQTGTISGRVTAAESGSPLPGVQISVSGVANTITRDDGGYSITVRPGSYKVRWALLSGASAVVLVHNADGPPPYLVNGDIPIDSPVQPTNNASRFHDRRLPPPHKITVPFIRSPLC